MRKVFLENLPRKDGRGSLKNKEVIDWVGSVGHRVRFTYDDIEGEIEIEDYSYKTNKLNIRYSGNSFSIYTDRLKKCSLGKVLNKISNDFKISIPVLINTLNITDRKYIIDNNNITRKYYKYKCNKCGYENWIREEHILNNIGCACCSNKTIVYGINDIETTAPWMIDLGVDKEEAKMFASQSNKKIKIKCPHCGKEFYRIACWIYRDKSIGCTCGDGFSYPEKIVYSMLRQLKVKFKTQYNPVWIKPKKYDFYVPSLNIIIETHGIQHYESSGRGRTLQEEQENDRAKRELALSNGVNNYIELDCRESDLDWISNNVINSKLNGLFDLSKIDWLKCEEFAINSNKVKEICNYWNNKEEWETTANVANIFQLDTSTIRVYLNKGSRLGWCTYDGKVEISKNGHNNGRLQGKKIEVTKDGVIVGVFESIRHLVKIFKNELNINLDRNAVSWVANGLRDEYKGYKFKFI